MTASPLSLARIALLGTAMVALLASPDPIGAERQQRAEHKPGHEFENALCEFGGGSASTHDVVNIQIDGHASTQTAVSGSTCSGGMFDGMTCTNYEGGGKTCAARLGGGEEAGFIEPIGVVVDDTDETAATDGDGGGSVGPIEVDAVTEAVEPAEVVDDPSDEEVAETADGDTTDTPTDDSTPSDDASSDPATSDPSEDGATDESDAVDEVADPVTGGTVSDPVMDVVVEPVTEVEVVVEGPAEVVSDEGEDEEVIIL